MQKKERIINLFYACLVFGLSVFIISQVKSTIEKGSSVSSFPNVISMDNPGANNNRNLPSSTGLYNLSGEPLKRYVSNSGNDKAAGTIEQPWKSIQYAVNQARPGSEILIRGGIYNEPVFISSSGNEDYPIKLSAYPDEGVMIDGGSSSAIISEGSYWNISGLTLTSSAERVIKISANFWTISSNTIEGSVYIWGNNHVIIGNDIDGSKHLGNENGILEDGKYSYNNIFRNNKIHGFEYRGIWSQWDTSRGTIDNNYVYDIMGTNGICIDLDGATSVIRDYVVRANIVHDCSQSGIELENAFNTLVENNLVYRTGLEGIQVISYDGCKPTPDQTADCRGMDLGAIIRQNIIFNAGRVGGIVSYESSGVKVYNNTVYGNESVAIFINSPVEYANNWDIRGNIFSNNGRAEISVVDPKSITIDEFNVIQHKDEETIYELRTPEPEYLSMNGWQQLTGIGANYYQQQQIFTNPEEGDFHILTGSAAVDNCPDYGLTNDFEGNLRPQGDGYECGAYEYPE